MRWVLHGHGSFSLSLGVRPRNTPEELLFSLAL
jgi:hypothetical protein